LTETVLSPRIRQGEEAHIEGPADQHRTEPRPDGVSTLRQYWQALWRRKWLVLVPLVLLPLVAFVTSRSQEAVYEASADVLVNRQEAATTSVIGQTPALDDPDRTMETNARLARVPEVLERTVEAAGVPDLSPSTLRSQSTVFSLADILRFVVSDGDPARAERLASAHASAFVQYRRELDTAGLQATLAQVRRQLGQLEAAGNADSPLYERLADRELQLETLTALRTSNVSVVQTAQPGDAVKVAPRPRRDAALALGAGLVIGLILAFLWETFSTRPRSEQEFESLLGMPFLARVTPGRGRASFTGAAIGPDADAVHALRTNFDLASRARGARTIMVASPREGEAASAIAAKLGIALARVGRHVTLVDADLRTSTLTQLLGLDGQRGVANVVRGEHELADAIVAIPLDRDGDVGVPAVTNGRRDLGALLEAVGSGSLEGHPSEILSSSAFASVLAELERRADLVLVATPAVLDTSDAAAVAAQVDALLLVVSDRDARGPTLAGVRRAVDAWPAAKLGFALTHGAGGRLSIRQLTRGQASAPTAVGDPERVA
jgi:tyrosine-protein kinase